MIYVDKMVGSSGTYSAMASISITPSGALLNSSRCVLAHKIGGETSVSV
jgi:hypothetical protein